jgi:DNA-binding PadR family transcriptional regulator
MSLEPSITPQAALLRVLITGESDGPEIIRKIRDWTEGQIELDDRALDDTLAALESAGMVERRSSGPDKRTGGARPTFALTPAGHASAVEILATSLTRKG